MRPEFHFTAATGWINDPHGITARNGEYHAFFQFVPERTTWAPNCHWGHAAGPDLLSLRELPVAIAPGEGDDGIWTGSLVTDDDGRTRVFYTSTVQPDIGVGRIRVAEPEDDGWISWRKGPVVAEAPRALDVVAFRDPFVIKEGDAWRMFVGAGTPDGTAHALTYTSSDLESWTYEGVALERSTVEREPVWMGALWECPQIFAVDGRWVMVSSVWEDDVLHYAGYAVGEYADGRFRAEHWGRLTYGPSYYAPSFFRDASGRPCLTFWMRGIADVDEGWASAHSVPHTLRLVGDVLVAEPHPDLDQYLTASDTSRSVPGLAADVRWSPATEDALVITSGPARLAVRLDRRRARLVVEGDEAVHLPFTGGEVRVVLDAQTVEVSAGLGVLGLAWLPAAEGITVDGTGDVVVRGLRR